MHRPRGVPHRLTPGEVDDFLTTADINTRYKSTPKTREAAANGLRMRNPWRWRRMRKDLKWARRQLEKMGYDPEEIRWLL